MSETKKYTVECEHEGCSKCGHMRLWMVIDPDGIGGGTSYASKDDAEEIADLMNEAYERGLRGSNLEAPHA